MEENKKIESAYPGAEKAGKSEHKKTKGEKRLVFNVVDVVLGLLILTFLAMIVFFFATNTNISLEAGQNAKIEYTVEIDGISQEMAAKISAGNQVFDGENKYVVGTVSNTEINDCVEYIYNEESGRIEAVAYTDDGSSGTVRKTLLVTITADAKYSEGKGYTVNGYRISVNQLMSLCFPNYAGEARCISMIVSELEGQ